MTSRMHGLKDTHDVLRSLLQVQLLRVQLLQAHFLRSFSVSMDSASTCSAFVEARLLGVAVYSLQKYLKA